MGPVDLTMKVLSSQSNKWHFLIALSVLIGFAACQSSGPQPAEIVPEDMCTYCRMAISEKRYAAQFLDEDGQVSKFDDVACMMNYLKARKDQSRIANYYVVDFDSRQWIAVPQAYFVRSPRFKTPMGGAIIAFRDKTRAEQAVVGSEGRLANFSELRD
jgi:copper chaperone NosL